MEIHSHDDAKNVWRGYTQRRSEPRKGNFQGKTHVYPQARHVITQDV